MGFNAEEKLQLLSMKNIGPKTISRLEELGFSCLEDLAKAKPEAILQQMAMKAGASCWYNNPSNRAAIAQVVQWAKVESARRAGASLECF